MRVAIVMKGYPRLSETFIAQELLGLQQGGLDFEIYSLRRPYDPDIHPIHREITAPVHYLPEYLHEEPLRVLRAWWKARRLPGYRRARALWLKDLRRDISRNRVRRFGQALVMAAELPASFDRIYVHFLHTPASVTRYAAKMRQLPWSCSAHAKDIYTSPDWEVREKLCDLDWLVTCTKANVTHLRELGDGMRDKVHLLYHGLDLERFPSAARKAQDQRQDPAAPVEILSVGRAVEKKGYGVLLQALAALSNDASWRFTHIGGGALRDRLQKEAADLGIAAQCRWLGALPQSDVLAAYRNSDIFVLASRIADDGDRDGLPNVLMEAQSQGLACISTAVSAIPELIVDGESGLLVPPDDPGALAGALAELINDRDRRSRLATAGEKRVREAFGHQAGVGQLLAMFSGTFGSPRPEPELSGAALPGRVPAGQARLHPPAREHVRFATLDHEAS